MALLVLGGLEEPEYPLLSEGMVKCGQYTPT